MKSLFFLMATVFTASAFAISTPLQLSKSTLRLALASVSLDEMTQIVSLKNSNSSVILTYVNSKGICYDQKVPIQYDNQGMPSVPETLLPPPSICK